ncbi:MAG TPA: hypothetical protein VN193_07510 [Candidatus Angelobacter sp.]|nr:hypothetical protein [Candidatus Angelobacter sp.]
MLKALLRRLGRPPEQPAAEAEQPAPTPTATIPKTALLVDASTWTFWSRGASAAETLIEATGHPAERNVSVSQKVAAMLEARDRSRHGSAPAVPRYGDPAQAELLFVEMMRAGRFERAYRLMAPECQQRWGNEQEFAIAQQGSGHDQVRGAEVKNVEILDVWPDPDSGRVNREVAELAVEYLIDVGGREVLIERVVHCLLVEGRWRSLCYPPRAAHQ